jgi:hypothetical protein
LQLRLFLAKSPVRDQSLLGGGYIDRDTTTGKRRQLPVSSAVGRNRSRKKSHMRYENLLVLVLVGCVGCAAPYAPNPVVAQGLPNPGEPVLSQVTATPVAGNPDCHNYTALATIDGKQEKIVGKACRQSDGSWAIAEGPPTNPNQYTTVYWPPTDPYYADYEPWLWDAPMAFRSERRSSSTCIVTSIHFFMPGTSEISATPGISENSAMPGTSENSTTPGASADSMVAFRTVAEPDFPHVRLPLKWEPITKWGQSRCLPLVTRTRVLGDGLAPIW